MQYGIGYGVNSERIPIEEEEPMEKKKGGNSACT